MAYIPSECTLQEYEEQVYSGSNNHRLYIKYGDTIIGDEANEYASPFASSLKWTRRLLDNGSKTFNLDCFVSQEIELVLNDYVIQDITQEIDIKIGTYIEKLNKWVYIPLGKYLIQDNPTTNENRTTYKLKDKSKLFDFKYNAEPLITSKGGKATLLEILDDICSQANVNYVGSRTFSGYNEQIGIYDNTINARIYVSYIAEQSGSIATIDRNGNLTFIKIKQSELTTREVSEDIVEGFTDGDNFIISKVVYESGIIKYEKGNDNNDTLYINSANPYVSNQTQVDNIYNIVNGLNINSFAISKIYGNPTFDPWDLIVLNYEGKTYKTFAQYIFTFNGVFTSKYETTIEHSAKKQNVSINSEATFRKYAKTTIDNIDAKVNIATGKVEQIEKEVTTIKETSGNNSLYVEDALESRVLEYGIDGKSEQETRSGKNLYNSATITSVSNGTNNNGVITSNTFSTKYLNLAPQNIVDLEAGTYYFSADIRIISGTPTINKINDYIADAVVVSKPTLSTTKQRYVYKKTYTSAIQLTQMLFQFSASANAVVEVSNIMISKENTSYEPYGASPSPDYPSEIKSVDGIRNLFDSLKGTSTTKNGMTITCTENSIILNGTTTAITNFWFDNLNIPLKKGAISFLTNVNLSGKGAYVWKENSTNILQTNNSANITIESDKTITQFLIQINSGVTFNNQEFKILLAEGNVSTYVPYGNWLKIQTTGKNLFNKEDVVVGYVNADGTINSIDGTYRTSNFIPLKPNTIYYKGETLTSRAKFYDKEQKPLNTTTYQDITNGANATSFTTPANAYYLKLSIRNNSTDTFLDSLQIEEGSTATPYEPYKENISLIDLKDNELCSIGDIKDTLIVNPDGTATLEKKIGKVVLNGSEALTQNSGKTCYYYNSSMFPLYDNKNKILSNYFKGAEFNELYSASIDYGISLNLAYNRLTIRHKDITDLTQFKTWLSTHNVEVYYILAEPYTIELGQVDISLFENINHINLVDDIETDTRVKYLINNVMNGTYATKGELELTNEQFQTTITNEFNSLERQMTSITQTGGAIDLAIQSSKDYTDSKNESLDNRITNSENNYNDLNNKYNTLNGKITDMNFSFKTDGLTIGTSGSEINSKLDNKGLKIYNASTLIAIFNQNGSGFKKLIATESIQLQNLLIQKRVINTPKANNMEVISFFFNKSLIENLTDLESD